MTRTSGSLRVNVAAASLSVLFLSLGVSAAVAVEPDSAPRTVSVDLALKEPAAVADQWMWRAESTGSAATV